MGFSYEHIWVGRLVKSFDHLMIEHPSQLINNGLVLGSGNENTYVTCKTFVIGDLY